MDGSGYTFVTNKGFVKLTRLQRLIYNVIQNYPGVQNDEAALVAAVWRTQGWSDENTLEENLARVSHAETISRRRRELHEKGYIQYSDDADKMRTEAFIKERDMHTRIPRVVEDCAS